MKVTQQHNYPQNLMLELTHDELTQLYRNAHIRNIPPKFLIKGFLKLLTTHDLPGPCDIPVDNL